MKNKIFAIEAAPDAIPPKPNIAAMMATTKNITVQRNISFKFKRLLNNYFVLKNYLENTVPFALQGCQCCNLE
jgi:hypothetical protein